MRCLTHPINGSEVLLLHHMKIKSPISTTEPHVDNSTSRWILVEPGIFRRISLGFQSPTRRAAASSGGEEEAISDFTPGNGREV